MWLCLGPSRPNGRLVLTGAAGCGYQELEREDGGWVGG